MNRRSFLKMAAIASAGLMGTLKVPGLADAAERPLNETANENLKLDIYKLSSKQAEAWEALDKNRLTMIKAGRRSGSTYLAMAYMANKLVYGGGGQRMDYICVNRSSLHHAEKILEEMLKDHIAARKVDHCWDAHQRHVNRFILKQVDFSYIKLRLLPSGDTYMNGSIASCCFDANLTVMDDYEMTKGCAWMQSGLQDRTARSNGKAAFIYHPRYQMAHTAEMQYLVYKHHEPSPRNPFHGDRWGTVHMTTYENPHVSKADLLGMSRYMSKGEFIAMTGGVE